LLHKESGVSAKIGIIESEIAIECEAIVTFEKDKRDLENVVTENARGIFFIFISNELLYIERNN